MGFEINKLIAAILVTVLIVFGIGKISDIIFKVNETGVVAYKIEEPARSSNKTKTEGQIDISAFLALGNVEEGKKIFKKCVACHSINKEGRSKIGPALWGITSRNSGEVDGYKYSKALTAHGKVWSFAEMNSFLTKPKAHIKGTKMAFAGLKKAKDRAAVILYMNENTDNPLPLN